MPQNSTFAATPYANDVQIITFPSICIRCRYTTSFGFSIGDFLTVGKLAVTVQKQRCDASSGYKALAIEVRSLQNILLDVEGLLQGDKLSSEKKMELLQNGQAATDY